jgi:type VI secretion system protein ImpF
MPSNEAQDPGTTPSILDRLIDPDSAGTRWRRGYGAERMAKAVARDLEDLLNTRQSCVDMPEGLTAVRQSLVTYGMPDIASLNALTPKQREEIGRVIESAIALYEPRLRDVQVSLLDVNSDLERNITFQVTARLDLEPALEIAFATELQLSTGQYKVKDGGVT